MSYIGVYNSNLKPFLSLTRILTLTIFVISVLILIGVFLLMKLLINSGQIAMSYIYPLFL